MHLVSPLVSGIAGAGLGYVQVFRRGTSTRATWYDDFEGESANSSGANVSLDSNGGREMYVNQLVDVLVYSSAGVLLRQFVAGSADSAIEVRSPSFTGSDYETGATAAGNPTTLEAALDAVVTSFGSTNFNVLAPTSVPLKTALSDVRLGYFNVKSPSYGAAGNGTTDDTAAISAAITAATGAGATGGVVYFPQGSYRITSAITVPYNVSLEGAGPNASSIRVDTLATNGVQFSGSAGATAPRWMRGLKVAPSSDNTGALVQITSSEQGLIIENCSFESGAGDVNGYCVRFTAAVASVQLVIQNCYLEINNNVQGGCVDASLVGAECDVRIINSRLVSTFAGAGSPLLDFASSLTSLLVFGCAFEAGSFTGSSNILISTDPTIGGGGIASVIGNRFNAGGTGIAINMTAALSEFGNSFSSGYISRMTSPIEDSEDGATNALLTRDYSVHTDSVAITTVTIPEGVGVYKVLYTGAGDLTATFPSAAQTYRKLMFIVHNDTVTNRTVNFPAATKGSTSMAVNGNTFSIAELTSVRINSSSYWVAVVVAQNMAE